MKTMLGLGLSSLLALSFLPSSLVAQDPTRVFVEGILVNAVTGEPVRGADVSLSELDLRVYSDSAGHFRLTDLALGSYRLSISADGFRAAEGDFLVGKTGTFTILLEPLDGPVESEFGQVRGTVRDRASGKAMESAEVSLPAISRTTLTDDHGRFSFRNIPPGRFLIRTEYLGYGTRTDSVAVPSGHLVMVELELSVVPVELEPITVVVELQLLSLNLSGFYDRREATSGIFLARDEIVAKQPIYTTDIFNSLPGVRVMGSLGLDRAVVLRGGARLGFRGPEALCGPTVYLDGILYERGGLGSNSAFLDRIVRPDEIAGIEIYTSAATVPLQYKGLGADCGVIVIWTR